MPDCSITLRNVDIDFTIYGVHARSMKNLVLRATTGGVISFPNSSQVVVSALNNISIDVKSGERVGLIGHNGAGKTTLLRVLAGVYEPVRGSMKRIGKTSSLFDLSYGFDPNSTGLENILIRGMYLGLDRATLLKLREGIADFSELGGYVHIPVNTYSAGMLMRLAFAISTSVSPDILLMDEWLAVGDANFQKKAEQRLLELIGGSGILVMATHSLGIMERICNRLIWLDAGTIRADGPFLEVREKFLNGGASS
jgi:lipopolysaccharide transport system ATP-binding protein